MTSLFAGAYSGRDFSPEVQSLLELLKERGFGLKVTGYANKTVRIYYENRNCGYINETVLQRKGVLGYHFQPHGQSTDACPRQLDGKLFEFMTSRYECSADALDVQRTSRNTYLIFRDANVALRVLAADAGVPLPEDVHVVRTGARYVEGRLVDVVMTYRERSEQARSACLSAYGFDCVVCGVNLKRKYRGMDRELIHVHHEDPLSQAKGSREFDPIETMKPVCPNCHSVIHSRTVPYSIEEVRTMLLHAP